MTSRLLAFALIGLVALVIGAGVVMSTSTHSGEQFAVDGFQTRSFSYYEVFGIRLSATTYFDRTGNFEETLAKKKWITATGNKPTDDQWITVEHVTGGRAYTSDAQILLDYLAMTATEGAIDLHTWSINNPGYAAIMWPEVQTAAQGNMYILVPDIIHHMLHLSGSTGHPAKSQEIANLNKEELATLTAQQTQKGTEILYPYLKNLYLEAAKAAQGADDPTRAKFCYEQALRFDPMSTEIAAELAKFPAEPTEQPAKEVTPDDSKSSEDESEK
ncbi:hypothetical protein DTL42_07710 [Bremerella cremea]|uniref:Uncharacterized protein n=2 Tax=Bremerella cremea TaxID=1031537 RepID=A0A368KUX8_9BACT|nr:hypothetical protein DTL42_07710 [Bremerella cremea]